MLKFDCIIFFKPGFVELCQFSWVITFIAVDRIILSCPKQLHFRTLLEGNLSGINSSHTAFLVHQLFACQCAKVFTVS